MLYEVITGLVYEKVLSYGRCEGVHWALRLLESEYWVLRRGALSTETVSAEMLT